MDGLLGTLMIEVASGKWQAASHAPYATRMRRGAAVSSIPTVGTYLYGAPTQLNMCLHVTCRRLLSIKTTIRKHNVDFVLLPQVSF